MCVCVIFYSFDACHVNDNIFTFYTFLRPVSFPHAKSLFLIHFDIMHFSYNTVIYDGPWAYTAL